MKKRTFSWTSGDDSIRTDGLVLWDDFARRVPEIVMGMKIGGSQICPGMPQPCLQIIWVSPDVCRLLSDNVGCWQSNMGLRSQILSINLG